ncbi:hypothetical protein M8R20_43010 [Pseudomonas sp. R2.Fl]|nr:hypothetical protein [Pseudomonas sp. R2.Fl]
MNRWNIEPNTTSDDAGSLPQGAPRASHNPASPFATAQEPRLNEAALTAMAGARQTFFAGLGNVRPYPLPPPRHPVFTRGPVWPALRQSWRVIQRPDTTLIFSDGLSDPFDPFDPGNPLDAAGAGTTTAGLGIEVYAEARGALADPGTSWLFELVHQVSQNAVAHGGFLSLLRAQGAFSLQMKATGLPDGWLSAAGLVTVLVGVRAATIPAAFPTPRGRVSTVALTMVPASLRLALDHEEGGFAAQVHGLAEQLGNTRDGHLNDPATAGGRSA